MKKKILCLLFASLILLWAFPLGVFATSSSIETEYKNLLETTIEYDFVNVFGGAYSIENYKQDTSINELKFIGCVEGKNQITNRVDLFLYLYNPSQKTVDKKSKYNNILMSIEDSNEYNKYNIQLIDTYGDTLNNDLSTNALLMKFVVSGPVSSYGWTYNMTELELYNSVEAIYEKSIIAKIYEFETNKIGDKFFCNMRIEKELSTVELDAYHTYYRVNTVGFNKYEDLQSVYFAVPNALIETCGDLWAMKCVWDTYQTNNVLVTGDTKMEMIFEDWIYGYNPYNTDFKFSVVYGDVSPSKPSFPYGYNVESMTDFEVPYNPMGAWNRPGEIYDYDDNNSVLGDFYGPFASTYDFPLKMVFYSDNVDSYEEKVVDGAQIISYLHGHKITVDGERVFDDSMFSNHCENETTFTVERKNLPMPIYEKCSGWTAFWSGGFEDVATGEYVSFDTFMEIDKNDVKKMSVGEFTEKYLVDSEDFRCLSGKCGECLQCRVTDSEYDDCTWFLLRYDVTDFQAYDALICNNISGTTQKACVFNGGVIDGFDTISVTFKDIAADGDSVMLTFPIVRTPTQFAVDGYSPSETPNVFHEITDSWFDGIFDWLDSTLIPFLKVALIVIAVLIVLRIVLPLLPNRQKIKIEQGKDKHKDEKSNK